MGQYYYLAKIQNEGKKVKGYRNEGAKLMEFSYLDNFNNFIMQLSMADREDSVIDTAIRELQELFGFSIESDPVGTRYVMAGDYADDDKFFDLIDSSVLESLRKKADEEYSQEDSKLNLYSLVSPLANCSLMEEAFDWKDISEDLCGDFEKAINDFYRIDGLAWVNHDKKEIFSVGEYVDGFNKMVEAYAEPGGREEWIVSPINLLIADGNGRGGGDFRFDPNHAEHFHAIGSWAGDRVSLKRVTGDELANYQNITCQFPDGSAIREKYCSAQVYTSMSSLQYEWF